MCVCVFVCLFQYITAPAPVGPMQGTFIHQLTSVPPSALSVEVNHACFMSYINTRAAQFGQKLTVIVL